VPIAHSLHARPRFRVRDELRGSPLPCWVDRSGTYGESVYGSPVGSTGDYVVGLIGDGVDVALASGATVPPGTEMQDHVDRVAAYISRAMPGLDADPVGVRVCVMSKLPAGSDSLGVWQTEAITIVAGHNLFKLAPALGELLADAGTDGRVPDVLERVGERSLTLV
jgi:sarcosine oxidase